MKDLLRLVRYVKPYWRRLAAAIFAALMTSACFLALLGLVQPILDEVLPKSAADPTATQGKLHILDQAREKGLRLLLTRLHETQFIELPEHHRARIDYEPVSRTGFFDSPHAPVRASAQVTVVAAGTSDVAVSRAEYFSAPPKT